MSKRELAIALLLFMGLLAPLIEVDGALFPQDQTISIVDTHDDKWTTGTGSIGIDSWLVHVLDPGYDVSSWTIFRDVEINNWEPLHNATLRLYTGNTLDFDKESMITIYGMKVDELQNILPIGPSYAASVPKTSAHVNLNTSQFYGPSKWWDIDVTAIVEELIRAHNWDGDGLTSADIGDAIGFVMLGARGYDVRYFVDYRSDPALSAQLVIHWNHQPPLNDPPDDYEYVEEYGNYSIWLELPAVIMDYIYSGFTGVHNVKYGIVDGPGPFIVASTSSESTSTCNQRKLVRTSNDVLYATFIRGAHVYVKRSFDNGETWIDEVKISTNIGASPSMAIDSSDVIHIVFIGGSDQVYYANYTDSWSTILDISDLIGYDQMQPTIAVDSQDYLHVSWAGGNLANDQIQYKNYTDSWSTTFRISPGGPPKGYAAIAVDSSDHIHVAWHGDNGSFGGVAQIWHREKTVAWSSIYRVSTYSGMDVEYQMNPSIAIDTDEGPHIVWDGQSTGFSSDDQIWENNYNGTHWYGPVRISTKAGMHNIGQITPSISIDLNNSRYVIWRGKVNAAAHLWLAEYEDGWKTPTLEQAGETAESAPIMRFPVQVSGGTYFITDENGTIVVEDLDSLDDAHDWIDIIDPDPLDPDPPGWVTEGPFTRFKMRLYLLVVGYFAVWGPIWFMCWRRPSGYHICGGALIMLMGLGLLLQIVYV